VNTTPGSCRVELYDHFDDLIFFTTSFPDGSADLGSHKKGTYTVKVTKEGYIDYTNTFDLNRDKVIPVTLSPMTTGNYFVDLFLTTIEALLGWTKGSLLTMLGNIKDLITNFFGDIYDFFTNIIGDAWDAVSKFFGDIADFVSDQFMGFVDWIIDIGGDIAGFVSDKINDVVDFVTTAFTDFTDWLNEIGGSVADYIGGAIGDFVDWSSDQLGGIWDGVTGFFMDAISGFVDAFWSGVNTGIEEAKHSPLHSDEPVRNPVTRGLIKVVRKHRKTYNKDEITGADKYGRIRMDRRSNRKRIRCNS